jgi:hypothetical protein
MVAGITDIMGITAITGTVITAAGITITATATIAPAEIIMAGTAAGRMDARDTTTITEVPAMMAGLAAVTGVDALRVAPEITREAPRELTHKPVEEPMEVIVEAPGITIQKVAGPTAIPMEELAVPEAINKH